MKEKSVKFNAILNVIKQCCSVLFPMITFPYISRILQSEKYGRFNFAHSFVSYFALIASLGISTYAIREGAGYRKDKKKFSEFANEVFTINVASTLIAYALLFLTIGMFGRFGPYRVLILILSTNILFTTLGQDWVNSAYEDYFYITIRYIATGLISLVMILMLVKDENDLETYAVLSIMSSVMSNIFNFFYVRRYAKIRLVWKAELKRHLKPILILFANALTISIYIYSDTLMLGMMQGDTDVGIYSVSSKIYLIVKQLLNAIVTVSIPRFSYLLRSGKIMEYNALLRKTLIVLFSLVLPAVTGLFCKSRSVIIVFSGEAYVQGEYSLKILSISLFFALLASIAAQCILLPHRREALLFRITVCSAIINVVLNFILIPHISYNGAALTTLAAELCTCIWGFVSIQKYLKIGSILRPIICSVLGCAFICLVCAGVDMLCANIMLNLIFSVGGSVLVYGIVMLMSKNEVIYPIVKSTLSYIRGK